jgi:hypothetical protein
LRSSSIAFTVSSIELSSFQPRRRKSKAAYLRLIVYAMLIEKVDGGKVQSLEGFFQSLSDIGWVAANSIVELFRLSVEVVAYSIYSVHVSSERAGLKAASYQTSWQ